MAAGFGSDAAPLSGSRAERYQVVLHVDAAGTGDSARTGDPARADVSAETCGEAGTGAAPPVAAGFALGAELDDGTRVCADTSRRLACDAGLVAIGHAPDGAVLDVGRRTRTIPPAIRRALEARDRGCRFPGCGSRFCDAHHVRHWSEGGETRFDNLVLLCRAHHRMVHEGGYRVELVPISAEWRGGGSRTARPSLAVNFYDPRGVPIPDAPAPLRADRGTTGGGSPDTASPDGALAHGESHAPGQVVPSPDLVAALLHDNGLRGIHPDRHTTQPRWRHDDDIPTALLVRALQAVDPGDPADPGNRAA
jgi:hypothetical protein